MDDKQLIETAKKDLTWLQKHERLIALFLLLVASVWIGNKLIDRSADKDRVQAALALQQLEQQKTANAQQAQQNAATTAQYQAMVETLTRQNAALASAISARNTALAQQQQANQTMPLPDLANRWKTLIGAKDGDLTATPAGIAADDAAARTTVNQLEQVPVLTQNLVDETKVADNKQAELDKANTLIGGLNTQVSGLNAQVKDQDVACKAEIASVKADARKSKRNWFLRGMAVGGAIALRLTLHF